MGVFPEKEISYPRINPSQRRDNELTNGHTHFFLLGDETKKFEWGDETKLKFDLAQRYKLSYYNLRFTFLLINNFITE